MRREISVLPFALDEKKIQSYQDAINRSWQETTEAILKTCALLVKAKDDLDDDEYKQLIQNLAFSKRTLDRLLAIGRDKRLETHVSQLPPSWGTLHEISRLDNHKFKTALREKVINPSALRKDITAIASPSSTLATQNQWKGMIKVASVYVKNEDVGLEIFNLLEEKYGDTDAVVIDSQSFIDKLEKTRDREHKKYTKAANKRAIKIIREYDREARKNLPKDVYGKFDNRTYAYRYGEVKDFLEGGTQQYYEMTCSNIIEGHYINEILSVIGSDRTTHDFFIEEFNKG